MEITQILVGPQPGAPMAAPALPNYYANPSAAPIVQRPYGQGETAWENGRTPVFACDSDSDSDDSDLSDEEKGGKSGKKSDRNDKKMEKNGHNTLRKCHW